ncbi:ImmA/IrrE family metallo-endopeptidase [Anaerovorax sp. IOR16]|uniref:ImmA/IrrE family metallo-endopeptidase n=1 Tax=Anaerovorax sp. IOR16 TaxID=2773458 RepID=UPI0019D096E4|nr:ImmA/IrrE family metallo-endopeptidase [Anaerovorax sp. IOR16]
MHNYLNKVTLYKRIEEHRNRWGVTLSNYPINTIELCKSFKHLTVKEVPFFTTGLRGLATKRNTFDGMDIIILNENRNAQEKNFDCGHELIHLVEHRNAKTQSFHCFEKAMPNQNKFMEWQANEGSAELILPYKIFIKQFCDDIIDAKRLGINVRRNACFVAESYAQRYNVTESFIKNRVKSLAYEMCQYYSGTDLDDLKILSRSQLSTQNIDLKKNPLYSFIKMI